MGSVFINTKENLDGKRIKMNKKQNKYNITIVSKDENTPKGFKLKEKTGEFSTFTRDFVGTTDSERDTDFIRRYFSKMFTDIQHFEITLI